MTIKCIHDHQADNDLKDEIYGLVKSSYADPRAVLGNAYNNNQRVYLLRDNANELIAFFMAEVNKLEDDKEILYLRLACVKDEHKNSGLVMKLFIKGIEDCDQILFCAQSNTELLAFLPEQP